MPEVPLSDDQRQSMNAYLENEEAERVKELPVDEGHGVWMNSAGDPIALYRGKRDFINQASGQIFGEVVTELMTTSDETLYDIINSGILPEDIGLLHKIGEHTFYLDTYLHRDELR